MPIPLASSIIVLLKLLKLPALILTKVSGSTPKNVAKFCISNLKLITNFLKSLAIEFVFFAIASARSSKDSIYKLRLSKLKKSLIVNTSNPEAAQYLGLNLRNRRIANSTSLSILIISINLKRLKAAIGPPKNLSNSLIDLFISASRVVVKNPAGTISKNCLPNSIKILAKGDMIRLTSRLIILKEKAIRVPKSKAFSEASLTDLDHPINTSPVLADKPNP